MAKEQESKLDAFVERLDQWFGVEKKTLAWVQKQLHLDGCDVSTGRLSEWWSERQSVLAARAMLAQIATGAKQSKEIEAAFAKNPAPELETLIKLQRVIVLQLSTQGAANPDMVKLADQLTNTVISFVSGRTKAEFKERELRLAEDKFQLEFCEKILDQALRDKAAAIASSNLSNADKIAAMRKEAFKSVDELQASGKVKIPKV